MAQFDVHRNEGPQHREVPFVVVVQSRRLDSYGRRVVVPLVARVALRDPDPGLNPAFEIEGRQVILHPLEIASVPSGRLGERVASLDREADRIIAAIDMVISRVWG